MMLLKTKLIIALGGALGSVARFMLSKLISESSTTSFPLSTLVVNVLGCLIIGFVYALFDNKENASVALKQFLTIGFCGGFTTFSTFSNESFNLYQLQHFTQLVLYITASVVLGFLAIALGATLGQWIK